ncbi:MAG TPA: sec-independent translocase [Jatrophihabitans sp.]|jgi:sec-independent protein translocase protein TatB
MFNIGPMELLVLAVIGLIVMGPERLPQLARDAARMLRTLREMANGARTQLRDELGPEFADVDFRNLNPRTAITRAVLGDTDTSDLNPANFFRDVMKDEPPVDTDASRPAQGPLASKPVSATPADVMPSAAASAEQTPATPKPAEPTLFDSDAT